MTPTPRIVRPINWNRADEFDLLAWKTLTENFWLPEAISLTPDLKTWDTLSAAEKQTTVRVFMGLTVLDTIQASVGAISLIPDATSPHEEAVLLNIGFMEAVHAKSYSTIFSTLCSTEEIDEAFAWAENDEHLNRKSEIILSHYDGDDPLKRKVASTLLESFLFFSGFYMSFHWASKAKLTNTADIIRLIVRDETVHGTYIGSKYMTAVAKESKERQAEMEEFTYDLMHKLYRNEVAQVESLYDPLGLSEDVKKFLHVNANKALMNLGYDPIFEKDQCDVNPATLANLSLGSENHDFFSAGGSSYKKGAVEDLEEDEWDF